MNISTYNKALNNGLPEFFAYRENTDGMSNKQKRDYIVSTIRDDEHSLAGINLLIAELQHLSTIMSRLKDLIRLC